MIPSEVLNDYKKIKNKGNNILLVLIEASSHLSLSHSLSGFFGTYMKIETINIADVVEYENNAKLHPQEQIEKIKKSILEFGNNDPIAIDENNVLIEGHGRLKALKQLGFDEVEAIRLSHLSEEQKKAYILVHNKLNIDTGFDVDLLNAELEDIFTVDMSEYGFELPGVDFGFSSDEPGEEVEGEFHRETTINQYNLDLFEPGKTEGRFEMPILEPVDHIPKKLQGFNYVLNKPDYEAGVHFFLDDYQFERIWQRPEFYIEKLSEFDCVLTPDFSLYIDMPVAMQVWNVYRSRLIGQVMQRYGYTVIPTVSWGYSDSFSFCFDGLPEGATLAVSTIGVKQNEEQFELWKDGMDVMIELLRPKKLIVYGGAVDYDYGDIEVHYFENATTERMKQHGR